jgi:hypothetical protein
MIHKNQSPPPILYFKLFLFLKHILKQFFVYDFYKVLKELVLDGGILFFCNSYEPFFSDF